MINQNLHDQQLLAETLSPGAGTHGFVFFKISEEKEQNRNWTIVFKTKPLKQADVQEIAFPCTW